MSVAGDPDEPSGTDFSGVYQNVRLVLLGGKDVGNQEVTQRSEVVYCQQSWRASKGDFVFPPTSRLQPDDETWMTSSQETLTNVYGWTSLGVFIAFVLGVFGSSIYSVFISFFRNNYQATGKAQRIDFSANPEIFAYVPQIKLPSFPFPLIACDIDDLYQELIGWTDTSRSYDFYNLMFDVPFDGMKRTQRIDANTRGSAQISDHEAFKLSDKDPGEGVEVEKPMKTIFSVIKHYPPPWLQKIIELNTVAEDEEGEDGEGAD